MLFLTQSGIILLFEKISSGDVELAKNVLIKIVTRATAILRFKTLRFSR